VRESAFIRKTGQGTTEGAFPCSLVTGLVVAGSAAPGTFSLAKMNPQDAFNPHVNPQAGQIQIVGQMAHQMMGQNMQVHACASLCLLLCAVFQNHMVF